MYSMLTRRYILIGIRSAIYQSKDRDIIPLRQRLPKIGSVLSNRLYKVLC